MTIDSSAAKPLCIGIYLGHDPGACLLAGGRIVASIEEERLTRYRHGRPSRLGRLWPEFAGRFGYFPWASVTYCLRAAAVGFDDLDAIAVSAEWCGDQINSLLPIRDPTRVLLAVEPRGGAHHLRHALSAFHASGFPSAAVLVVDDDGSVAAGAFEAESGYHFTNRRGGWREIFKNRYPRQASVRLGLGWMYRTVTEILGFTEPDIEVAEAGKTMGLAPYGGPSEALKAPWIRVDGFRLNFDGWVEWLARECYLETDLVAARRAVRGGGAVCRAAADLAWKAQSELEAALLVLATHLHKATGEGHLCLAGGIALNAVANSLIVTRSQFHSVFVQPAAGDGGQAIGLAYGAHLSIGGGPIEPIRHAFGGREYLASAVRLLVEASGLDAVELADDDALAADAAQAIAEGAIIGWFQGGSEIGPRALGHRSILADARDPGMKERLNERVKFREPFRPFAPSILEERASEVFELDGTSPYMLRVVPVRNAWRTRVPSVTHVDGTARVQTVNANADACLYRLLQQFDRLTGVPLVLNTSFNLRGMPMVETPWDALVCTLSTDLDAVYLGRVKIARPPPDRLVPVPNPAFRVQSTETRVRFESRSGVSIEIRCGQAFSRFLSLLDGTRSLSAAFHECGDAEPGEATVVLRAWTRHMQRLVRSGVYYLAVGRLVFPKHLPGIAKRGDLSPEMLERLRADAGLLSALSTDDWEGCSAELGGRAW